MSNTSRSALALIVAIGLLATMTWFDTVVVTEARARGRATFETDYLALFSLGALLIASSVLLIWRLALDAGSLAVSVIYVLIGGFFALLPWTLVALAASTNDGPAVLPDAVANAVSNVFVATVGPLYAVVVVGASMVIAGVAVIGRTIRDRGGRT